MHQVLVTLKNAVVGTSGGKDRHNFQIGLIVLRLKICMTYYLYAHRYIIPRPVCFNFWFNASKAHLQHHRGIVSHVKSGCVASHSRARRFRPGGAEMPSVRQLYVSWLHWTKQPASSTGASRSRPAPMPERRDDKKQPGKWKWRRRAHHPAILNSCKVGNPAEQPEYVNCMEGPTEWGSK